MVAAGEGRGCEGVGCVRGDAGCGRTWWPACLGMGGEVSGWTNFGVDHQRLLHDGGYLEFELGGHVCGSGFGGGGWLLLGVLAWVY